MIKCPTCGMVEPVMRMNRIGQYVKACSKCDAVATPIAKPLKNPCCPGKAISVKVKSGQHIAYCSHCGSYIKALAKSERVS